MSSSGGPIASYRRFWFPELLVLLVLALAATILFSATRLDLDAARWFYHPDLADPWPIASHPLWLLFYRSAPWVTGSLAVVGTALLLTGMIGRNRKAFRLPGIFLLLCVVVGPGLIINGILKDHWGRPRPRQIIEFGGQLEYVPPLLPSRTHGKSFPCGHCSVGYLYAAGWWTWRRHRPMRATVSLAAGITIGSLLGFGRMAAGGHFLSDVIWSGLIAYGVAHVLYYHALRIPAREDAHEILYPQIERNPRVKAVAIAAAILLGVGIVGGGILASPHHKDLTARIRLANYPAAPEIIEIQADILDVELLFADKPPQEIECTGYIRGFGLPNNKIYAAWEYQERPVPVLRYLLSRTGWFTDIDGIVRIRLSRQSVRKIIVRLSRGDISVIDESGGRAAPGSLPLLELHTADGRVVQRPAPGS